MDHRRSRRDFLGLLAGAAVALTIDPHESSALFVAPPAHPEPRPGIDAAKVLRADQLANTSAAPVYDMVREIPEVIDGIRCHCGCAELEGYYSLLTCYEQQGMAQFCDICKGQARQAYRLHRDGKDLEAIRAAADARYG